MSIISAVPARYSSAVSGPEWQPTSHRPTASLSNNQSTSSICSAHRPIGTGCTSATAGEILFLSYFSLLMVTCFTFLMIWRWLFVQVTIQVQEVELGGGAQRQGSFLSTPGGHRVLGKQLSADNAESHRWPHASCHLSPDGWQYQRTVSVSASISYFFILLCMTSPLPSWHLLYFMFIIVCISPFCLCFAFLPCPWIFYILYFETSDSSTAGQDRDFMCERADRGHSLLSVLKFNVNPHQLCWDDILNKFSTSV